MNGELLALFVTGWGVVGWVLWFYERARSRDYATDLSQLIHDYDLGHDDLRRSLSHQEIEDRID